MCVSVGYIHNKKPSVYIYIFFSGWWEKKEVPKKAERTIHQQTKASRLCWLQHFEYKRERESRRLDDARTRHNKFERYRKRSVNKVCTMRLCVSPIMAIPIYCQLLCTACDVAHLSSEYYYSRLDFFSSDLCRGLMFWLAVLGLTWSCTFMIMNPVGWQKENTRLIDGPQCCGSRKFVCDNLRQLKMNWTMWGTFQGESRNICCWYVLWRPSDSYLWSNWNHKRNKKKNKNQFLF